jgi:hypothetical protein
MRRAEIEELMMEQAGEAETAIAELVATSDVEELTDIAKHGSMEPLKLRAIRGLSEIASSEATAALVEMLEAANQPFRMGGSEQRREHEARQAALARALAQSSGVAPPPPHTMQTQAEIAELIEACRKR